MGVIYFNASNRESKPPKFKFYSNRPQSYRQRMD